VDRDALGRLVRKTWVLWAYEQLDPKPSWLMPYDALTEPEKEVDRRIGEAIWNEVRGEIVGIISQLLRAKALELVLQSPLANAKR
jgi:hypothetical protein